MNKYKKNTASVILGLGLVSLITATGVSAAVVTESFTVEGYGDYSGTTGTGIFSYDDSLISGSGNESVTAALGLKVELTVLGQTFTEQDDVNYHFLPALGFTGGVVNYLDFTIVESDTTEILEPGVWGLRMYDLSPDGSGGYLGPLEVGAVPVPAAVWLFGSGLLGLAGVAGTRRRSPESTD